MALNPDEINEADLLEALSWLCEALPRGKEYEELLTDGPRGDETFTMRLDGDDLGGFVHAIDTLHAYFGFDREKRHTYWDQTLKNVAEV